MKRYELEDIKRSVEYLLDEINKSLDELKNCAAEVELQSYSADSYINEMKQRLFDFYNVFLTAHEEQKLKIEKEEENPEEV
jgi:soluble P-type ATPase